MLNAGERFGDYTVVRLLGKGGMGSVFLLENAAGGQVAAKILDPETAGDHEARKRFLREAELALGVKHPNLVETYDVGEDPETGLCYILMEYVPGGSLADLLKKSGSLPVEEAVAVVQAMAQVLELARGKGIVHRDIKPANIMFDAEGTAKLADLGVARGGPKGLETTTVTQTGAMIGTPAYMAPEQMLDAHHVDTRADIYSLGVVFFEMLTGERPNKDDTVVQLMAKAVKGEPLPDVRTMRPEVSASIAQLLAMMVAPDKDGRISTPGQIKSALDIISRGGKFEYKVPKAARRRKFFSVKIALFVLVFLGLVAGFAMWMTRQSARRDVLKAIYEGRSVSSDIEPVDVERTVEKMVSSLLGDADYIRRLAGGIPVLAVSDIKNKTSHPFDTAWIADSVRTKLVRTGMFRMVDDATQAGRTAAQGGPQFLLSGSLEEMNFRAGGERYRHYKLMFSLKQMKTGEIIWSDEQEFRKRI